MTVLAAVTGPFGSHEAMPFTMRLIYWGGIVALSVGFSMSVRQFRERLGRWPMVLVWGVFILFISCLVFTLNHWLFPGRWTGWNMFFYLLGVISVMTAVVFAAMALIRAAFTRDTAMIGPEDAQALFLRRLTLEKRAPLIRIEAQDHYLNVVTEAGSELILLRLGEAIDALAGIDGLQVHRSHWVKLDAVKAHRRVQGRDVLTLADGHDVPVSRSFRPAAQQAGLF